MKLLTRLQLINWLYFSNEIIRFEKINFLTGTNSAGKSTIIDALQAALMGETRSSRFNPAAGKNSERTFRSYLVGTLGDDVSSGIKSLREGKDFSSYVVAEFYDNVKDKYFCVGVVADVYHDGSDERKRWFILEDKLPSQQFVKNGKTTVSSDFFNWGRQNYTAGSEFRSFDSAQEYRESVLHKTNVFDQKVFTMLRKAIAFKPISNIEEFITTNICDIENNIDTFQMQEDIKSYQWTEQQAKNMVRQQSMLQDICEKYDDIKTLRCCEKIQQFFVDYGNYCDEQDRLEKERIRVTELSETIYRCELESEQLSTELKNLMEESNVLNTERTQFLSDTRKDYLEHEKEKAQEKINTAHAAEKDLINRLITNTGKWIEKCDVIQGETSDEQAVSSIDKLQRFLKKISGISEQSLGETSLKYFSDIKESYERALCAVKPIAENYSEKKREVKRRIDVLNDEIETLNSGRKSYPKNADRLKEAIQKGLSEKYDKDIAVDFLADLIDVTDNEWKNAVEGVLGNNRMNIIVAPQYFMEAYYIYKRVYEDANVYEYSVVDLERVFADQQTVKSNSLAQVVKCDDKYVRSYINYLLGGVIRCYDDEKIRNFRTSVTKDCMLYRGYAVRPINPHYYEIPYIGSKSIEEQLKQKTEELERSKDELTEICSYLKNVNIFCESEWFLSQIFLDNVAAPAFEAYSTLPALMEKLHEIDDKLSKIDAVRLAGLDLAIKQNKEKQDEIGKQRDGIIKQLATASFEKNSLNETKLPELERSISEKEFKLTEQYDVDFRGREIPEFEKRLPQYGTPKSFADAFSQKVCQTQTNIKKDENELVDKRSCYNSEYHLSSKHSDTSTNDEYDAEYKRISEIELPAFSDKIAAAKQTAMDSFRNDFVNKLKNNIQAAIDQINDLNRALSKAKFGNNTYHIERKINPDYIEYYEMIMAAEEGENLFSHDFREKYKDTIDNLFSQLELADGTDSAAAEAVDRLSRYSTYLTFDLQSIDNVSGMKELLSKTINAKSGGEIQTPFYVAMLASFAQLYRVNETRDQMDNTMRLVIFDEAFNKMDPERISESISVLREFGLQAIICSPPDKAGDISPLCDRTLLVDKQADGNGGYRSMVIEWTKEMGEMPCDMEKTS